MRNQIVEKLTDAAVRRFAYATPLQRRLVRPHAKELAKTWYKSRIYWLISAATFTLGYLALITVIVVSSGFYWYILLAPLVPLFLLRNMPRINLDYSHEPFSKKILEEAWGELFARNNLVFTGHHNGSYNWIDDASLSHHQQKTYHKGAKIYSDSKTGRPVILRDDPAESSAIFVDSITSFAPNSQTDLHIIFMDWKILESKWAVMEAFGDIDSELRFLILSHPAESLIAGVEAEFTLETYFYLRAKGIPSSTWADYKGYPVEWIEELVADEGTFELAEEAS